LCVIGAVDDVGEIEVFCDKVEDALKGILGISRPSLDM
jgi:hypothetical protein